MTRGPRDVMGDGSDDDEIIKSLDDDVDDDAGGPRDVTGDVSDDDEVIKSLDDDVDDDAVSPFTCDVIVPPLNDVIPEQLESKSAVFADHVTSLVFTNQVRAQIFIAFIQKSVYCVTI